VVIREGPAIIDAMRSRLGSRRTLVPSGVVALALLAGCATSHPAAAPATPPPELPPPAEVAAEGLIPLDADDGRVLLARSVAQPDLTPLLEHFTAQEHGAYCGVASMVVALNALGVPAPSMAEGSRFHYHTQQNFFSNPGVEAVATADFIQHHGMTLDQLGAFLAAFPLTVQVTRAGDSTLSAFRQRAIANLERPGDLFLVNFHRPEIGQEGGGHISPLAAYDAASDRFLLLDVARYRYPPTWIPARALYDAMNTTDRSTGLTRGFVEVAVQPAP
jgi:hypothetical protein